MGCNTSRPSYDNDGFHSRSDTPSIYSRGTRTTPSHSRNNSNDHSATRPFLGPKFSDNTPVVDISATKFLLRRTSSHRYPRGISEKQCTSCGHERQRDKPCFGCMREKPKPRRHRSRRNAQVLIPRSSVYGGKKKGLFRANSIETPLREEDLPPWVTARHGVFVPKRVATELNHTISLYEQREHSQDNISGHHGGRNGGDIIGGYIVSPEAYYSRLPLPDLPPEAYAQNNRSNGTGKGGKGPIWI